MQTSKITIDKINFLCYNKNASRKRKEGQLKKMGFAEYVWVLKIRDYPVAWADTEQQAKARVSWVGEDNTSINLVNWNEIRGVSLPNVSDIPFATWVVLAKLANECDELNNRLMNVY